MYEIRKITIDKQTGKPVSATNKLPVDIPKKAPSPTLVTLPTEKIKVVKNTSINGHWRFDEQLGKPDYFGFVYLIHDLNNNKMYIGKKQFFGSGKLNKGIVSDWRSYTSSCKALQESIRLNGKDRFKFYALDQYKLRGSLGYAETWSLCKVEALCDRDRWYNGLINKVSWNVKEGVTMHHRHRLLKIVEGCGDELGELK